MEHLIRLLRPGTFIFWGIILLGISYLVWKNSTPESNFWARISFPAMLVSWVSGVILMVRVKTRTKRGNWS